MKTGNSVFLKTETWKTGESGNVGIWKFRKRNIGMCTLSTQKKRKFGISETGKRGIGKSGNRKSEYRTSEIR